MRRMSLRWALVLASLASADSLRAGAYNLDPPPSIYRRDYLEALQPNAESFRTRLPDLRAIDERAEKPGTLRVGYRRQLENLQARQREKILSPVDRVNWGACLIRLGRLNEARAVLEEAQHAVPPDDSAQFLILLNLARAYQEEPELLPRAIVLQTRALKIWPQMWVGWTSIQSDWYRRVETFVLRLMNLRMAEGRAARGRGTNYQSIDPLFAGVRFVGPKGQYEAGELDFVMRNKLPLDAESVVVQMILWQPTDDRLFWLYGELLNARGEVEGAFRVLDQLVDNRKRSEPELIAHRRVLRRALESFQAARKFAAQPADWQKLLWAMAPRGQSLSPGLGCAANETAWMAALQRVEQAPAVPSAPPSPRASSRIALPDWRHLLVSFVTGIVVAVLAVLQWQQWRRRQTKYDVPSAKYE